MLGSGAVIVMDDSCCMGEDRLSPLIVFRHARNPAVSVRPAARVPAGCGDWWTVFIGAMGVLPHGDVLDSVASNIMGRTICALGDAAAMPVRAMLKHYRPEIRRNDPEPEFSGCSFCLIARKAYG